MSVCPNSETDALSHLALKLERFAPQLCRLMLDQVWILPRRMQLETGEVRATVPMLRGVWGCVMERHFPELYHRVFSVPSRPGPVAQGPPYVLRPAPADPDWAPAVEWILVGDAIRYSGRLLQCWHLAGGRGLTRDRESFIIRRHGVLIPEGQVVPKAQPWPLSQALWPCASPLTGCVLNFPVPLRIRYQNHLVLQPTLADIVAALVRRLGGFLPEEYQDLWRELGRYLVTRAHHIPAQSGPWKRQDLVRFSGSQKKQLQLWGVVGTIILPQGPQELLPLLAAAPWIHVGKGTVFGMGQMEVHALH